MTSIRIAIGIGALISLLPTAWMAVITWNAIIGIRLMPEYYGFTLLMCVMWWVGLFASWMLARYIIYSRAGRKLFSILALVGVISCVWFEYNAWNDSKQLFPPGFISIPILAGLIVGIVGKMLANKSLQPIAKDAAG